MKIIGTGIDIVGIERLKEKIKKTPLIADKMFTPGELAYCKSKKNHIQHIAGRVAAKEAIYKALGKYTKGLYWKDIEIINSKLKPVISDSCKTSKIIKENNLKYSLSISHEKDFAVAQSIFWKEK